jgi:hypothetical protein
MADDTDIAILDGIQFYVDHERARVACNDAGIFLEHVATVPSSNMRCLRLHWHSREIPVSANFLRIDSKLDQELNTLQYSAQWDISEVGHCSHVIRDILPTYAFKNHDELFFSAQLVLKALSGFGGSYNNPQFIKITVTSISVRFDPGLQTQLYRSKN